MVKAKWLVAALFLILPFASFVKLSAFSGGTEGYTGDPATGGLTCNECHDGGAPPTTTIGGPTVVQPGAMHVLQHDLPRFRTAGAGTVLHG